jgi:hypothetical protein
MNNTPTWFQQQLNEEAKRIGKSATDRFAIENPTVDPRILKHFYEEQSIQMAANVISNRMLQYFLEQITAIIESPVQPVIMHQSGERPVRSLVDRETNMIKLSKIYEDNENEVIDAVIMFLKMELQMIYQQQMEYQRQMQMQKQGGGIQTISGSGLVR